MLKYCVLTETKKIHYSFNSIKQRDVLTSNKKKITSGGAFNYWNGTNKFSLPEDCITYLIFIFLNV